jgi:CheY-like chemotaxis protein
MNSKKILVVDDNLIIVKTLRLKLEAAGYKVVTAADASSAIKAVRDDNPDLLIMDINFPADVSSGGAASWDGFGVLQWLERINQDWHKPVVIITGEQSASAEARAKAISAVAFFRKPLNHDELLDVIRRELGEDGPAPTPPA